MFMHSTSSFKLNFLLLYQDALKEAREVDTLVSTTANRTSLLRDRPFLGVPLTVKECIALTGMPHTAGLVKRQDVVASEDAEIVKRLRAAGAIPVGVTNTSECCMWMESYNNVYGVTNNPYNLECSVGGSSGGEAAILAVAGSVIGIGSDSGGSIRIPAFCCGVFGHKPTAGISPREGSWPIVQGPAAVCSTVGPLCRFSKDLPAMLDAIVGLSPSDTSNFSHKVRNVDVSSLKVVSIPSNGSTSVTPEVASLQAEVELHLKNQLHATIERATVEQLKQSFSIWSKIIDEDPGPRVREQLMNGEGRVNPFLELGKWLFGRSQYTLPSLEMALMDVCSGAPKMGEDNAEAHTKRDNLKRELEDLMGDNGVILYPTMPRAAMKHHRAILHPFDSTYTIIFNALGFPATAVPVGTSEKGLPLGIQIISKEGNDHLTIAVAMALEETMAGVGWHCPERFPL